MAARVRTNYPGVYYREVNRRGGSGKERVYYIVFKQHGKVIEEKVGKQIIDCMTPAKAALIRGERVEGRRKSRRQKRQEELARKEAEENRWTIDRLWTEYKATKHHLKGIIQDENRYRNYIGPTFGVKTPEELSPFDVDKFRLALLKTRKPATVRNILELLRRVISFGVKKQLCSGLSFMIEMPRVNNQKTEDLTTEQLARLLSVIDEEPNRQIAHLMKLVLFTGMRRGELFNLKWTDLDFERGFIHIRDPKGGVDEKIPMNQEARDILTEHPKTDSSYVFPGRRGGRLTDVKKQVNRIKDKAGLPKDFRALHGLRHVYASMLASSGKVDMYTLQKLLTHKSPTMTQRYAHLRDEALRDASNVVGELIVEDRSEAKRVA